MYLDIPEIMTLIGALMALGFFGALQYVFAVFIGFGRSWSKAILAFEVVCAITIVMMKGGYPPFVWGFPLALLAGLLFGYNAWQREEYLRTPPADEPPKPRGIDMRI